MPPITSKRALIWTAVSSQIQAAEDKVSLEEQERLCRQWCASNNYAILKHLSIPGFSRSEEDPITLMEELAAEGVYAYHELRTLWQQQAFDVLVAYHHSRLARSQTVYSWVVNNVIASGASIYLIDSGWINPEDAAIKVAIEGFSAANEISHLIRKRHAGMRAKMSRGIPTHRAPMSHRLVRNELGKVVRMEVDEDKRRLIEDVARLILEGIGWKKIEAELYTRYLYTHPATGEPYAQGTFNQLFHNPLFWGNNVYGRRAGDKLRRGLWCFDPAMPIPDGLTVYYGTHEPALREELAERVKTEMRRRVESIKGKARPYATTIFSGLLVCGLCHRRLSYHSPRRKSRSRQKYYVCPSQKGGGYHCDNTTHTPIERLKAQITPYLEAFIQGRRLEDLLRLPEDDTPERLAQVEEAIAAKQESIRTLIRFQARNPARAEMYQEQIEVEEKDLEHLEQQRRALSASVVSVTDAQRRAVDELRVLADAPKFWQLSDQEANQRLHTIFGKWKFEVIRGTVTRLAIP